MKFREEAIEAFLDEVSGLHMHGFLLTLRGETVAEGYWAPFAPGLPHRMYSVSKSVVSAAIGMLVHQGRICLDDRIVSYFPEYTDESTDPLLKEVTIRNMLTMATCYDRSQYSPLCNADWTRPFFSGHATHIPGTVFSYDTSASQVMASLVKKITGDDVLTFMGKTLFPALGMDGEKCWLRDAAGNIQGGTGLVMTLRDLSRFANFWMSDGLGLVDPEYIRAATSRQVSTLERSGPEERYGYGYQLWMMREGFAMYGLAGQMAMCLPEKGITLCTTANLMMDSVGVQPLYDAFFRHLANIDEMPSDPSAAERLSKRLAGLKFGPLPQGCGHSSVAIDLTQHTLPFSRVVIQPDEVQLCSDSSCMRFPLTPGCWANGSFMDVPCLVSACWEDEDHFHLHLELMGTWTSNIDLFAVCKDRRATVRVAGSVHELVGGWNGQDWGSITLC